MGLPEDWFSSLRGREALDSLKPCASIAGALKSLAIAASLAGLVTILAGLFLKSSTILWLVEVPVAVFLLFLVSQLVWAGLIQLTAMALGGKGSFSQMLYLYSSFTAPLFLAQLSLLVLSNAGGAIGTAFLLLFILSLPVFGLFGAYLATIAVDSVHGFGLGRAFASWFVPLAVIGIVGLIAALMFAAPFLPKPVVPSGDNFVYGFALNGVYHESANLPLVLLDFNYSVSSPFAQPSFNFLPPDFSLSFGGKDCKFTPLGVAFPNNPIGGNFYDSVGLDGRRRVGFSEQSPPASMRVELLGSVDDNCALLKSNLTKAHVKLSVTENQNDLAQVLYPHAQEFDTIIQPVLRQRLCAASNHPPIFYGFNDSPSPSYSCDGNGSLVSPAPAKGPPNSTASITITVKWPERPENNSNGPTFDFSIMQSPNASINRGGEVVGTVVVSHLGGPVQIVNLSVLGCPPLANCTFKPSSGFPLFNTDHYVFPDPKTPPGDYLVTVVGTSSMGLQRSMRYNLRVT